jgi:hypothetical protein
MACCELSWLGGSSRTQVLGSTPRGSELQAEVKKIPSVPRQSTGQRPGLGRWSSHMGYGATV